MKLFYGWIIVAAGFVISCVGFGEGDHGFDIVPAQSTDVARQQRLFGWAQPRIRPLPGR